MLLRIAQGGNVIDSVTLAVHFFKLVALWKRSISSLLPKWAVMYFLSQKSPSCHPVCCGLPISQQKELYSRVLPFLKKLYSPPPPRSFSIMLFQMGANVE